MWGRLLGQLHKSPQSRFIPTHVGQTRRAFPSREWETIHPHACGADCFLSAPNPYKSDSSPRMWGRLTKEPSGFKKKRFIPTHVGQTKKISAMPKFIAIHPHACGADKQLENNCSKANDSSPRMWGRQSNTVKTKRKLRFIPTHVGQTPDIRYRPLWFSIHPHACGADSSVFP